MSLYKNIFVPKLNTILQLPHCIINQSINDEPSSPTRFHAISAGPEHPPTSSQTPAEYMSVYIGMTSL